MIFSPEPPPAAPDTPADYTADYMSAERPPGPFGREDDNNGSETPDRRITPAAERAPG